MFNLLPGQGLGFTGSKEISFGLAPIIEYALPVIGGGGGYRAKVRDNAYRKKTEDDEEDVLYALLIAFLDMENR